MDSISLCLVGKPQKILINKELERLKFESLSRFFPSGTIYFHYSTLVLCFVWISKLNWLIELT